MIVKRIYFLFYTLFLSLFVLNAQSDLEPALLDLKQRSDTQTIESFLAKNDSLKYSNKLLTNYTSLLLARRYIKTDEISLAEEKLNSFVPYSEDKTDSIELYQNAFALELRGHLFYKSARLDSARFYLSQSSSAYAKGNNPKKAFYNLNMTSTVSYLNGNYYNALKSAYDAIHLAETEEIDSAMIADLEIDIGNIYLRLEQFKKADSILTHILLTKKSHLDDGQLADIENNLGLSKFNSENPLKTIEHFENAQKLYASLGDNRGLSKVYNNLATYFIDIEPDPKRAIQNYEKAIAIKHAEQDSNSLAYSYYNISGLLYSLGNIDSSYYYVKLAETYQLYKNDNLEEIYFLLSKIHQDRGQYKTAVEYEKKRNLLIKEKLERQTANAYKLAEEKQLVYLQHKEIELLEKNEELSAIKINRKNILIAFITASFGFLFVIFTLYIFQVKKQKRVAKELYNRSVIMNSLSSLLKGQEEERKRIAEDLHDGIGSALTLLNLKAKEQSNAEITRLTEEITREVRQISHNIMPDIISKLGLREALLDLTDQYAKHDVILDFIFNADSEIYSDTQQKLVLYRIIQELIKNAVDHGKANYISVHCEKSSGTLDIHFEDNGDGFDIKREKEGMGLKNIKNRVSFLNGKIRFSSNSKGTSVKLSLPLA